jgi:Fe2+ transport system protein FeoA
MSDPAQPEGCCPTNRRVALSQLKPGQAGVVRATDVAAADAAYLGAMGLCCNAKVKLCRAGEPCIVAISTGSGAGCRIGLARPLAERIMVEPVDSASDRS